MLLGLYVMYVGYMEVLNIRNARKSRGRPGPLQNLKENKFVFRDTPAVLNMS